MATYTSKAVHSGEVSGQYSTKNAQDLAAVLQAMNVTLASLVSNPVVLATDDTTVTAAQSGTIFQIATDAKTFTLPLAAAGLEYTFQNTGASDAVLLTILPQTGEAIYYDTSVVTKELRNTKTGANQGDFVTLYSDGTAWFPRAITGVWVKEG